MLIIILLKINGTKARILKDEKVKLNQKQRDNITEELLKSGKLNSGTLINYDEFKEIYNQYKDCVNEEEFAELLGINHANFYRIKKFNNAKTKVIEYKEKKKTDRIKYILAQESRYYTEEELKRISTKYDCDINTIIKYALCVGKNDEYVDIYSKLINNKRKLWIGKTKCNKKFAEKHAKTIIQQAEISSRRNCNKYNCRHMLQDISSDSIAYILEQCGDIGKNFEENEEISKKLIALRINTYTKYRCLERLDKPKEISFQKRYESPKDDRREKSPFNRGIRDDSISLQDEVEEAIEGIETIQEKNISIGKKYYKILLKNIKGGLTTQRALELMEEKLLISQEEILLALRNYMINENKVKETQEGEFILGE